MNEEAPSPLPPPRPAAEPTKHEKRITLAWVLTIIMTLVTAVFAWLYFGKDAATPQPTEQTDQIDQNEPDDNGGEEEEATPAKTVYQAEIGKFKLELPAKYAVVEKLDGGFEGGPATSVEIGETSANTPNVVVTKPGGDFKIFARPLAMGETVAAYSQQYDDDDTKERQDDEQFANQTARVYVGGALFSFRHVIFVNEGNIYEITLLEEDSSHNAMLAAVKAGFSFVE